jgi:hypothetical protein
VSELFLLLLTRVRLVFLVPAAAPPAVPPLATTFAVVDGMIIVVVDLWLVPFIAQALNVIDYLVTGVSLSAP